VIDLKKKNAGSEIPWRQEIIKMSPRSKETATIYLE
jgi:hypothetical protein